jgi:hypothetical protein
MTLVSARGPLYFPALDHASGAGGDQTQQTVFVIDAAAEKLAFVVRAPKAGILHKVRFRTTTVGTGDTLKVSFQDLDTATGAPDGTPDQFRTIVIADADDNASLVTGILSSDGTDGGTKRTVARGELLCVVFEFDSWVAGNISLSSRATVNVAGTSSESYCTHFTAAWVRSVSALPRMALEYSDGTYEAIPYVCPAVAGIATETYGTGTTPDERGLIFQLPFAAKVGGFWVAINRAAAFDIKLYDSDGSTVLESQSFAAASAGTVLIMHTYFDSEITLSKDTSYRMTVLPTTATTVSLMVGSYSVAAVLDALPGGQECHYTSRTDAGAWTEATTKRPLMGLILSELDDGVSVGGGGGLKLAGRGGLAG